MNDEIKRKQAAEEKRRQMAILADRDTIPMDFSSPSSSQLPNPSSQPDPLWKRIWKTEGIRWLGPRGDGMPDAMERFEHGFMLGYRHGVGDMLRELQGARE